MGQLTCLDGHIVHPSKVHEQMEARLARSAQQIRRSAPVLAGGVLLLLAGLVLLGWTGAVQRAANERVRDALETQVAFSRVGSLVQEAQSEQRAYLLSGDSTYLKGYNAAIRRLQVELSEVHERTRFRPEDLPDLKILDQTIEIRLDLLARTLRPQAAAHDDELAEARAPPLMATLRPVLERLRAVERAHVALRQKQADWAYGALVIGGGLAAIGASLMGAVALRQITKRTEDVEADRTALLQINESLERRVEERTEALKLLHATVSEELGHRIKNTLAIVQSLARQTARDADSVGAFVRAFDERLSALASAQALIYRVPAQGAVDLAGLVSAALAPFAGPRLQVTPGPPSSVPAIAALSLTLGLHELATNALKYGALSAAGGLVRLEWSHDPGTETVELTWTERGGPEVRPPNRSGFGRVLIGKALGGVAGAQVRHDFLPEGVSCTFQFQAFPAVDTGAISNAA